jgi:hypothetical protein
MRHLLAGSAVPNLPPAIVRCFGNDHQRFVQRFELFDEFETFGAEECLMNC